MAMLQQARVKSTRVFPIDFAEFRQVCPVVCFPNALLEQPHATLGCMGIAIHEVWNHIPDDHGNGMAVPYAPSYEDRVRVQVYNYEPVVPLRCMRSNCIGKFITVRGTVLRVSNVRPLVVRAQFACGKCGARVLRHFTDGKFSAPTKCTERGCRGKTFAIDKATAETVDWQKIRLQEIIGDGQREAGRVPRTVEVELWGSLIDSCIPGDEVKVAGEVKVVSTDVETASRSKNKSKCMYFLYIDGNSVSNSKKARGKKSDLMQFTSKDLAAIRAIASEAHIYRLIVHSICPAIFGHDMVKAGLCLALFGGSAKHVGDRNKVATRNDPHMLVVGDPGLGKSQMLKAVSLVAPRGVYVCGNATTTSGLTVTVIKDSSSGDYALEAGALVLGDQGVCCIDEFDKMSSHDHQALLEAMEQQCISIAKAGIVCSLSARTSVIAAANPVGGHYNRAHTVSENLKMSTALLSRFDLMFILLDSPDERRDQILSEHIMALHKGGVDTGRDGTRSANSSNGGGMVLDVAPSKNMRRATNSQVLSQFVPEGDRLEDRLRLTDPASFDALPPQLLRKYIAYCRKYCQPVLTREAADVLQRFYLELRKEHASPDSTPITTRQLESLIRLAEARAKLELRELVTERDAMDVVEIFKESLLQTFADDTGKVDFGRTSGMSRAKEATLLVRLLEREARRTGKSLFQRQEIYTLAHENGCAGEGSFDVILRSLNTQGYLLKKGPRLFKLQLAD